MKVCPKCGKVIGFNTYFGAYICDNCGWEDDTYNKERIRYYSQRVDNNTFMYHQEFKEVSVEMDCSKIKAR